MDAYRPLSSLAALSIVAVGVGAGWLFVGSLAGSAATALTAALIAAVVAGLVAVGVGRVRRRSTPYW